MNKPHINKQQIIKLYKETYSVSAVLRELEGTGIGRERVTKVLTDEGIYEGLTGPNYLAKMKARVRVYQDAAEPNRAQLTLMESNKIPYERFTFEESFKTYRKAAERHSRATAESMVKPDYCDYTGVRFIDAEQELVNPNDPRKRTIDHKKSIIQCWLEGMTPQECAAPNNISFVLRYINNLKGNDNLKSTMPVINLVKEKLIAEGYAHKD